MLDKIEILKDNNDKITVDFIDAFKIKIGDVDKSFVIITTNELDQNGMIKLCVSELLNDKLVKVASDDDWQKIKVVMRSIISSSEGDFAYINVPKNVTASDDFFRVIAVQESAKTQLVSDYSTKKPKEEPKVVEEVKEETKEPVEIYPKDNTSAPIGSEVIPGIMEDNDTAIQDIETEKKEEPVADIPVVPVVEDVPKVEDLPKTDDLPNVEDLPKTEDEPVVTPPTEEAPIEETPADEPVADIPVVPVVEEPTGSIVSDIKETISNDQEEILFNKIKQAIKEYIDAVGTTPSPSDDSAEIERLKQELEEKNKKIESIMSLINPKD